MISFVTSVVDFWNAVHHRHSPSGNNAGEID